MKYRILKVLVLATLPLVMSGCMFYHAPTFKGTLLDVDTKQPIEGAVVVAQYEKETMNIFGGGSGNTIINVREALTDRDGKFRIPSYTTVIDPFSWQSDMMFIIFKPGYVSLGFNLGDDFSYGGRKRDDYPTPWNKELKAKFPGNGVVPGVPAEKMSVLLQLYNAESKFLGFDPIFLH